MFFPYFFFIFFCFTKGLRLPCAYRFWMSQRLGRSVNLETGVNLEERPIFLMKRFFSHSLHSGRSCQIFSLVCFSNPIAGCIIPYLVPSLFTVHGSRLFISAEAAFVVR